jgi:hypothetical protein
VNVGTLEAARDDGTAGQRRRVGAGSELVLAFRRELAADFLRIYPSPDATARAFQGDERDAEAFDDQDRQRKLISISVAVRDARFRSRVVRDYGGACAFCGLGASLVQAAHIQPVHAGGSDDPWNGLATCPTHHLAFDRGLIVVDDDLSIRVNPLDWLKLVLRLRIGVPWRTA